MESEASRRSDRVSMTLLLKISGTDTRGQEFSEAASTMLINRHGAVVLCKRDLAAEQRILVQRQAPSEAHRQAHARVVGQFGIQNGDFLYGIELVDPEIDLWGVEFPSIAESKEAVARMLLECSHCRRREVVYLNEMELRAFESNRGIARQCRSCGVPSIWVQAPHEDPKKIEEDLMPIIPRDRWTDFSHEVIWHGRTLCMARGPKCVDCKIETLCHAADKTWSTVKIHPDAQP